MQKRASCRTLPPALKKTRKLIKSCPVRQLADGKRKRLFIFSKFFSFTPTHAARQEKPARILSANLLLKKPNCFLLRYGGAPGWWSTGLPRRRAGVGVNQKILENLQRHQRRLLSASWLTALLWLDFQYFLSAGGSIVWAILFFGSFLLDRQKK
jgi:hypothetical protein